jgi:hypothetical protein
MSANDSDQITEAEALAFVATATPAQQIALMEELAKDHVVFWRLAMLNALLPTIAGRFSLPLDEVRSRFERYPLGSTMPLLDYPAGCSAIALAVAYPDGPPADGGLSFELLEH